MNESDNRPFYTRYKRQLKVSSILIVAMGLLIFTGFIIHDNLLLKVVLESPSENSIKEYETNNITGYFDEDFSILKIEFRRKPEEILDFLTKYPQSKYMPRTSSVIDQVWIDYQNSFNQLLQKDTLVSKPISSRISKLLQDYGNGIYEPSIYPEQTNPHEKELLEGLVNHTKYAVNFYVPSSKLLEQYASLVDAIYSEQSAIKVSKLDPASNNFNVTITFYQVLLSNNINQVRS